MSRLKKELDQEAQSENGTVIQRAWKAYQHGSLAIACELFESALTSPETKQEASRGLAHCFFQRGQYDKAIELLTRLIAKGVKPKETRTLLVEALFKTGKYDSALAETRLLDKAQAQQWSAIISTSKREAELTQARNNYDPKDSMDFVKKYRHYLDQCLLADLFLTAAQDLLTAKNKAAGPLFEQLFTACDENRDIKLSAYIGLMKILPPEKLRSRVDQELQRKNLPPAYRAKLLAEKTDLLHRMVSSLHGESSGQAGKAETLYREILSLNPEDKPAQIFLAWHYFNQNNYTAAHDYFLSLYHRYPHEKGIADGLAYTLTHLGKLDEAISIAEAAGNVKLQTDFLREKLSKNLPGSQETLELSQRILALDANDQVARSALAWWHYHHEKYQSSAKLFKQLSRAVPENRDYRYGLIYSLSKQNRLNEALDELQKIERHDETYRELGINLYMTRANHFFQHKNYKGAEADLKKVLELSPKDPDARILLGWSLYFQKETRIALDCFLGIWQEWQAAEVAAVLPGLFDEFGRTKEKAEFLRQLEESKKPELRKILGDYYANQGWNIRAAQTFNSPQSPYFNADQPSLSVAYLNRHKSGDKGTSYLEQQGFRLTYKYPFAEGQAISFELTPEHLSAGNINNIISILPVGNGVSLTKQTMQRALITSADLISPVLKYQAEGNIKQSYMLGTTPLNGSVEPMVTAAAQLEQSNWRVNVHQEPIMQSILSYAGLNDPFSSKSWGRVVRSGVYGNYTFALSHDYWLTFTGRTDYYWGKNVAGNFGAEGGISGGKSMTIGKESLTLGLFLTNIHFERNLNFFTFGNGGYFSPNYLFAAGPFLNFEHKSGEKLWWKAELSTNWSHSQSAGAAVFPLQTGYLHELKFDGTVKDGIGYRLALEGRYLLMPYLDISGRFSMEQSAAYSDMVGNVGIRLYFSPRNSIIEKSNY